MYSHLKCRLCKVFIILHVALQDLLTDFRYMDHPALDSIVPLEVIPVALVIRAELCADK